MLKRQWFPFLYLCCSYRPQKCWVLVTGLGESTGINKGSVVCSWELMVSFHGPLKTLFFYDFSFFSLVQRNDPCSEMYLYLISGCRIWSSTFGHVSAFHNKCRKCLPTLKMKSRVKTITQLGSWRPLLPGLWTIKCQCGWTMHIEFQQQGACEDFVNNCHDPIDVDLLVSPGSGWSLYIIRGPYIMEWTNWEREQVIQMIRWYNHTAQIARDQAPQF